MIEVKRHLGAHAHGFDEQPLPVEDAKRHAVKLLVDNAYATSSLGDEIFNDSLIPDFCPVTFNGKVDLVGHIVSEAIVIICAEHRDNCTRIPLEKHFDVPMAPVVRIHAVRHLAKFASSDCKRNPVEAAILRKAL